MLLFLKFLQLFVFLKSFTTFLVSSVVSVLSVYVPAVTLRLLLFFLVFLKRVSIQVHLVLADAFGLDFLFGVFLLFQPVVLFYHFVVVDVVFSDFLLQSCLRVEHFGLVQLQFQVKEFIYVRLSELCSHMLRNNWSFLYLLQWGFLFFFWFVFVLLSLLLQQLLLLVQLHKVFLAFLQFFLVLVSLVSVHTLGKEFSYQVLILYDFLFPLSNLFKNFFLERVILYEGLVIPNLPTVHDNHWHSGFVLLVDWNFCNLSHYFHTVDYLTEHHMLSVKMGAGFESYEELRGVCISTTIGHR